MSFFEIVFEFVTSLFSKITGWIKAFLSFIESVEGEFPGLIEIIERLYEKGQELIDAVFNRGGTQEEIEAAQAEAREMVIAEAKAETSASPRHVPEQAIRATLEAVVYLKKVMRQSGTKYDTATEMKMAQDLLRRGFGSGK